MSLRTLAKPLEWLLIGALFAYKKLVSPALPPACRYYPSCSQYALEAVSKHGPFRGSLFAAKRLLRCHPWSGGGYDPVPASGSRLAPSPNDNQPETLPTPRW